ncbi:MAG: hypothetical protein Ta2B_18440 [Termitinemataceae bacterium]|nr:MAG: hypothetical protein Ta2B_18440 [Termitinemataceae bacterium]
MSKLHVLGIGGTGHKLIESVVHLTACGAFKGDLGANKIESIRLMTIDADNANGNFKKTFDAIRVYKKFYNALNAYSGLGLTEIKTVSDSLNLSLLKDDKKSLSKAFGMTKFEGHDDKDFIHFLYTKEEVDAEFDQGFYGHTSIGTLIVRDILSGHPDWKAFVKEIDTNDFVVVMGSIFGGTGASAVPVVLSELNKLQKEKKDANGLTFKLSTVMLTPYFKAVGDIKEAGVLQPNSDNFQTKAKAALYYYRIQEQFEKTDALYILGEPEVNFSNERASRGASNQSNKAHPAELFAVTAIIDFIKESDNRLDHGIMTAERESANGEYYYTWNMLQNTDSNLPARVQKFIKMAVFFNKVLYGQLKNRDGAGIWEQKYDGEIHTDKDEDGNYVFENIYSYLRLCVNWFYDIHLKNLDQVDTNTDRLKWTNGDRVKLFNSGYPKLFDNKNVVDPNIDKFNELVYNDTNPKRALQIYSDFCSKTPKPVGTSGKGFPALFATLEEIIKKPLGFFDKKPVFASENFTVVPYLSKENNVAFIRPPADNSLWSKSQPDLLINIADGLPNVQTEKIVASDLSIPSPWSIFILNELTLCEKKFASLNKLAYNQWCGLIALIVLKKLNRYENFGLNVRSLKLGTVDNGEFLNIIKETLPPENYIFDDPVWSNLDCVSLNDGSKDVTIAFLAHNTIVCPAYSYSSEIKTKLHSIAPTIVDENGNFLSPDNYFSDQSNARNRNSKYALKLFLEKFKILLIDQAKTNNKDIIKHLQELSDKYIADLGKITPNADISIPDVKSVANISDMFAKLKIESKAEVELPFILSDTQGKSIALIGLNICGISCTSKEAANICITDALMYNQLNAENIRDYSGKTQDGVKLIYDNELLLDSMVMISKSGDTVFQSLTPKSSLGDYEVVWPINQDLLQWYSMDKIEKMLSIQMDNETVSVTITVSLNGKLGNHSVTKEYKIKNNSDADTEGQNTNVCYICDKGLLPFWAVWPFAEILDVNGNNTWHRYNFFTVEPKFVGVPVLETKAFFSDSENTLLEEQKLSTISDDQRDRFYKRGKSLPAALKISRKSSDKPSDYMGAVFLAKPKRVNSSATEWNIGLDFGTTTTTAFYTIGTGGADPIFIKLNTEYHWEEGSSAPIEDKENNDMVVLSNSGRPDVENYFIDPQYLSQNGYSTAYEIMDTAKASSASTIFDTGRNFWHNYKNFIDINTRNTKRRNNLLTNIKWESKPTNAAKYLNQLLTQIVYKAASSEVRKINWFFSYPTAFSKGAVMEFDSTLTDLIKKIEKDTGVTIKFNDGADAKNPHLITESIAAAYYFQSKNTKQTTFLCLDIGGNSSDISIWIKEKHIFQTSIRFASRDMFITPLERLLERKTVMDVVKTNRPDDGIFSMLDWAGNQDNKPSREQIKYFIENVLFEYYGNFKNRLDSLEGDDKKAYVNFKHSVFIAYSGLIFYLSNIIAALMNAKKIDNDITEIIFGLSGKGSKLTDWIKAYCDDVFREAQKLIAEKTKSGTYPDGIQLEFKNKFNPTTAKTETAQGMICNLDESGNQKSTVKLVDPEIFMGCSIDTVIDGKPESFKADSFIDAYEVIVDPASLKISLDKELSEFGIFLEFFNNIARKTTGEMTPVSMEWYGKKKQTLYKQIETEFNNVLGLGRFEPPFIVMLRCFIEEYSESGYSS